MAEPTHPAIATDLVEYVVLVLPGPGALGAIEPELASLVESAAIRVLDLVVVTLDEQDRPELLELDAIPGLDAVRESTAPRPLLLSRHDIELVSLSLHPGECAVVLVAEDRWARPLAAAARLLGGEVRAGERIARARVELALERDAEPPSNG